MKLTLVTAPTTEPFSLDELKDYIGAFDDLGVQSDLISTLGTAAREHVEKITSRAILTQKWDYFLNRWPECNYIKLPFGNLQNAVGTAPAVSWKDTDGSETTLTVTTDYIVETNGDQYGYIFLPYGGSWPTDTLYPSNPIKIRFFCGWTSATLVPASIKTAIKMACSDMFDNSEGKVLTNLTYQTNDMLYGLLANWRLWDEF